MNASSLVPTAEGHRAAPFRHRRLSKEVPTGWLTASGVDGHLLARQQPPAGHVYAICLCFFECRKCCLTVRHRQDAIRQALAEKMSPIKWACSRRRQTENVVILVVWRKKKSAETVEEVEKSFVRIYSICADSNSLGRHQQRKEQKNADENCAVDDSRPHSAELHRNEKVLTVSAKLYSN